VIEADEHPKLGEGTPDEEVLTFAKNQELITLTADVSDFTDPPVGDHSGVIIFDSERDPSGSDVVEAVGNIIEQYPDLSGYEAFVKDWH
jgi:hypothetical protein